MRKDSSKLPCECVGALQRKLNGIIDKIENGGLDYQRALNGMQAVFEGKDFVSVPTVAVPAASSGAASKMFKTTETDLGRWLDLAEDFFRKYFGLQSLNFWSQFQIPEELPWKSVIPVFDPSGLTDREAVEKALKAQKLTVSEEVDVMQYSGSEASDKPSLCLIQNSVQPDEDTLNLTPDQLVETGKIWLSQRGYALAFGLHHHVSGEYLDPATWTWFPMNSFSLVLVARGSWNPDGSKVRFRSVSRDHRSPRGGARLAISVPLRS